MANGEEKTKTRLGMDEYGQLLGMFENLDYVDPNIPLVTEFDISSNVEAVIGRSAMAGITPNTLASDSETIYRAKVIVPWKVGGPMKNTSGTEQEIWACKAYVQKVMLAADDPTLEKDLTKKAQLALHLPIFVAKKQLRLPIVPNSEIFVKYDNPIAGPFSGGIISDVISNKPDLLPGWAAAIPGIQSLYEDASSWIPNAISFVSQYLPGSQAQASYPAVTHTGPPDEDYALIIGDSQINGYFGMAVEQKLKENYKKVERLGQGSSQASHWTGADQGLGDLLGTRLKPALDASQPGLIFVSLGDNGTTGAADLLKFLRASAPSAKIIWSGPGKLARSLNSTAMDHLQGSKFNESQQTRINRNKELTGIIQGPNVVFLDGYDNWPSALVTEKARSDGAGYVCEEDCDGIHYTRGAAAAYANAISGHLLADL